MSTVTLMNYDSQEVENLQRFEKISRSAKAVMPVHRCRSRIAGSRKSPKSKSVNRKFNRSNGGSHRRRNHAFN